MNEEKVIARFQPQAWINDYAVDIDGAYDFDVTDMIVAMGKEKALELENNQYNSDALWQAWVADHPDKDHDGPFYVEIEAAVRRFFGEG